MSQWRATTLAEAQIQPWGHALHLWCTVWVCDAYGLLMQWTFPTHEFFIVFPQTMGAPRHQFWDTQWRKPCVLVLAVTHCCAGIPSPTDRLASAGPVNAVSRGHVDRLCHWAEAGDLGGWSLSRKRLQGGSMMRNIQTTINSSYGYTIPNAPGASCEPQRINVFRGRFWHVLVSNSEPFTIAKNRTLQPFFQQMMEDGSDLLRCFNGWGQRWVHELRR